MAKLLLLITFFIVALLQSTSAANIRTRRVNGGGNKGVEKGAPRKPQTSVRTLKGKSYAPYGYAQRPAGYGYGYGKSGKSGKSGYGKGKGKGRPTKKKSRNLSCRPVVEGAEFIVEGSITNVMANMTADAGMLGTEYIYNGPLLEFNDNDELQELENFFLSGTCVRTQARNGDMPGAGHCSLTVTLDTGATMNFAGEAFDGWDNLMAINGGSQELIGLSGTVTLIGLNANFEDTDEDFFSVPWIYGEAVLVYSICPRGYWDDYYIEDHDALPPPEIPNPFQQPATAVPQPAYYPVPGDDYYGASYSESYDGYYYGPGY